MKDIDAKTTTWVKEALKYEVSDVAIRNKVLKLTGRTDGPNKEGYDIKFKCAQCNKDFVIKNYKADIHKNAILRFCKPSCQAEYNKKHLTKNPVSHEHLKSIYLSGKSLRGMAEELGINKVTLEKRLHNEGLSEASASVIKAQRLKPFIKR